MKETIVKCDHCGSTIRVSEYTLITEQQVDSSGNGYESYWEYHDFCLRCLMDWAIRNPEKAKHIHYHK